MSDDTPHLKLPFLAESQQSKSVTVNDALNRLDALVQIGVKDRDLAAPPATPAEGDRYIVAAGGSGVWSGCDGQLAAFFDGAWTCFAPEDGWTVWVADEHALVVSCDGAWHDWSAGLGALQNLTLLGVGTTADATNPFAAKLNSALWTAKAAAEGGSGDLRYVFNKEAAANTASMLFQDGFSGRAEIGLTGDDDVHFKVSPDGATWVDALVLAHADGAASFPKGVTGGLVLPQTAAVLAAMTVKPSVKRQRLLNELIGDLIYAGVWDKLDALWVMAAHSQQAALLNLKASGTNELTAVNSPSFTIDRGFTGDGLAAYLDAGVALSALTKFQLDDAHIGAWELSDVEAATYAIGATGGGFTTGLGTRATTGFLSGTLSSSFIAIGTVPASSGHSILTRSDGVSITGYKNASSVATVTAATNGVATGNVTLLRVASIYAARQIAAAHIGGGLSAADISVLYTALQTYLTAVGAVAS